MFILFREAFSMIHAPFVRGTTGWNVLYLPFLSMYPMNIQNRSWVYDIWKDDFKCNPYITSNEECKHLMLWSKINWYRLILLYIEENQLQIYEYLSLLCFFLGMFILHLFVIISCNSLRVTKVCFIDTKIFGFDVIYWAIYSYLQLLCVTWI